MKLFGQSSWETYTVILLVVTFSPGSPRGPGNPGEPGGPLIENEV